MISELTGNELTAEIARQFYRFYLSTIDKMGAIAHLTEDFFVRIFEVIRDSIILYWAQNDGKPVTASLCYQKDAGVSLGLGSVSLSPIAQAHGGKVSVRNLSHGGAEVKIAFSRAISRQVA